VEEVFAIVLAGGRNERLWPLARVWRPKALLHAQGRSLLAGTLDRVRAVGIPAERTIVVGSRRHADRLSPEAPGCVLLLEPEPRDTAAAVALAALQALRLSPDPVLCVFPADHIVRDTAPVVAAMRAAISASRRHSLLFAFGTAARDASTAYGWLRPGDALEGSADCRRLTEYVEKPDPERARRMHAAGEHLWNCGTFVLPAAALLEAFSRFAPKILAAAHRIDAGQQEADVGVRLSLDHAVLEPATRAGLCAVVPLCYERDDVGRLDGLAALWGRDPDGNALNGDVVVMDSSGCVVASDGTALAALGLADMVVVAEKDVVLVCPRDRASDVRRLVSEIAARGRRDLL